MNFLDRYTPSCPQGGIQGAGMESESESESDSESEILAITSKFIGLS